MVRSYFIYSIELLNYNEMRKFEFPTKINSGKKKCNKFWLINFQKGKRQL